MEDQADKGMVVTLGVLTLSVLVLVGGHTKTVSLEKNLLEKQMVVLADRVTASKLARKQAEDAFEQREAQVKRVSATEAHYAAILSDLLELSKVDPDARLVVQKWKIQVGASGTGAEKPSPDVLDGAMPPTPSSSQNSQSVP